MFGGVGVWWFWCLLACLEVLVFGGVGVCCRWCLVAFGVCCRWCLLSLVFVGVFGVAVGVSV